MSVLMDIIVASVLGAVITLIVINANMVVRETWAVYNSDVGVQQLLISNAQIIECEFRNMGCGLPNNKTTQTIEEAKDNAIIFLMALRPEYSTSLSRIRYSIGPVTELTATENPNDRFLYRQQVGSGAAERVGMVTQFKLAYFTELGEPLMTPVGPDSLAKIRIVEITMEVQSPFATFLDQNVKDGEGKPMARYSTALWKQTRLASQNLSR